MKSCAADDVRENISGLWRTVKRFAIWLKGTKGFVGSCEADVSIIIVLFGGSSRIYEELTLRL